MLPDGLQITNNVLSELIVQIIEMKVEIENKICNVNFVNAEEYTESMNYTAWIHVINTHKL